MITMLYSLIRQVMFQRRGLSLEVEPPLPKFFARECMLSLKTKCYSPKDTTSHTYQSLIYEDANKRFSMFVYFVMIIVQAKNLRFNLYCMN